MRRTSRNAVHVKTLRLVAWTVAAVAAWTALSQPHEPGWNLTGLALAAGLALTLSRTRRPPRSRRGRRAS